MLLGGAIVSGRLNGSSRDGCWGLAEQVAKPAARREWVSPSQDAEKPEKLEKAEKKARPMTTAMSPMTIPL